MFEILLYLIAWLSLGVAGYLLLRHVFRKYFKSWTVSDRKVGLCFLLFGPILLLIGTLAFLDELTSSTKDKEQSKW